MLHVRHQHFVAGLHLTLAERRGHQIDGFRRATGEDNLFRLAGIDELTYLLAGCLVQVGSLLRQVVHAAVDVGIDVEVFLPHSVEHTQRLLGRCRIVQIDQRLAVHLALQDGEVFAYLIYIIHSFL